MEKLSTLKPGLLVSLKTSLKGGVHYEVEDLPAPAPASGEAVSAWKTVRTIDDVSEFERAKTVRSKARSLIVGGCAQTAFGLLCPTSDKEKLQARIQAAQAIVERFNAEARTIRVGVWVVCGQIASDDEQAARAINAEMAEILEKLEAAVRTCSPDAIRQAANQARQVSTMLSDRANEAVQAAIAAARKEARRLVRAGEQAAATADALVLETVKAGRLAFLDLDAPSAELVVPPDARAIDLEPVESSTAEPVADSAPRQLEFS